MYRRVVFAHLKDKEDVLRYILMECEIERLWRGLTNTQRARWAKAEMIYPSL